MHNTTDKTATVRVITVEQPGSHLLSIPERFHAGMVLPMLSTSEKLTYWDYPVQDGAHAEVTLHKGDGSWQRMRFANLEGMLLEPVDADDAFAADQRSSLYASGLTRSEVERVLDICKVSGVPDMLRFVNAARQVYAENFGAILILVEGMASASIPIQVMDEACRDLGIPEFQCGHDKAKRVMFGARYYVSVLRRNNAHHPHLWVVNAA